MNLLTLIISHDVCTNQKRHRESKIIRPHFIINALVENERLVTKRPKVLVTTIFFKG